MGQDCDLIWKDEKLHNQYKENNMGRTIKISELKKFDVYRSRPNDNFTWVYLGGYNYMLMAGFIIKKLTEEEDLKKEVELLGRMIFQEDGVSELLAEKKYKEECEDFVKNGP